jgi:integrase/recombinase XerD
MKLSDGIDQYLIRKRANGLIYDREERYFAGLYKQLGDVDLSQMTTCQVLVYLDGPLTTTITWRMKYRCLEQFFDFWSSRGAMPTLLMPPSKPKVRQTFVPYVYTVAELTALVRATAKSQMQKNCQIGAETFGTLLLLLYGTGAQVGELLSLTRNDVNLKTGMITIRNKKYSRYREIPTGADVHGVLSTYIDWRNQRGPSSERLFVKKDGGSLVPKTVNNNFQRLRKISGICRHDGATYQPRMHDIRYAFAVHRITSWIREGVDLNQMLPALAVYMGQVGLGSTERYLLMTPERFRKDLDRLSPMRSKKHWRDDESLMNFVTSL